MRRIFGVALVAAFALAVGSASGRDDKKGSPDDKKRPPEGTYVIVGMEIGGKAIPNEFLTKAPEAERTLKVKGDQLIAIKGGKDDPATFTVDPNKTPCEIDMKAKRADSKDDTMYGIYKIDGDKLVICFVQSDDPKLRPGEFKTTADNKAIMMTLKPIPPKK